MLTKLASQIDNELLQKLAFYRQIFPIDADSREYLLKLCRYEFNKKMGLLAQEEIKSPPDFLLNYNCIIFVSLSLKGHSLSCIAESGNNLVEACVASTRRILALVNHEVIKKHKSEVYFEVTLLFDKVKVEVSKFDQNFIRGLHAVSIEAADAHAIFRNAVVVNLNLTNEELIEKLIRKAQLTSDCISNSAVSFYLYKTIEFREDTLSPESPLALFDFFRCSKVLLQSEITQKKLKTAIFMAQQCLQRLINADGEMAYEIDLFNAEKQYTNTRSATIRKLGALWALLDSAKKNKYLIDSFLIKQAKAKLYQQLDEKDIGLLSFVIFVESFFEESKLLDIFSSKLANILLNIDFRNVALKQWFDYIVGFYALMVCFEKRGDPRFISIAEQVFPFCEKLLLEDNEAVLYLCAWLSRYAFSLYKYTNKDLYADFVVQLNTKIVNFQIIESPDVLLTSSGAFDMDSHSRVTAVYIESLAQGFHAASALQKWQQAEQFAITIFKALRPLCSNQLSEDICFYTEHLGAFKDSLVTSITRIDTIQHALSSMSDSLDILQLNLI
ncbi:MAG: hypothetical protein K0S08_2232 [Gammaproteobacteria bacterium]|jgi:hypothetical protein|nr:hypothetical protein [Gammaproteobacteria bacterium]